MPGSALELLTAQAWKPEKGVGCDVACVDAL